MNIQIFNTDNPVSKNIEKKFSKLLTHKYIFFMQLCYAIKCYIMQMLNVKLLN